MIRKLKLRKLKAEMGTTLAAALCFLLSAFCFRGSAHAQARVTLLWDKNPETNVVEYRPYLGRASRDYTDVFTTTNTSYSFTGLADGVTYYAAVTARDADGLESGFSSEVIFRVSPPPLKLRMTLDDPRTLIVHVEAAPDATFTNWDEVATLAVPLREFNRFYRVHLERTNAPPKAFIGPKRLFPPPTPH